MAEESIVSEVEILRVAQGHSVKGPDYLTTSPFQPAMPRVRLATFL